MYHHCTASEPKASATPIREKYAVSLLLRYGRMTSITSATHAHAVSINSGAINCRSETLMIEVVLACRSNIVGGQVLLYFVLWSLVFVVISSVQSPKHKAQSTKHQVQVQSTKPLFLSSLSGRWTRHSRDLILRPNLLHNR